MGLMERMKSDSAERSREGTARFNKREVISDMNQLLANEFGLFTKTLNYHWNLTGPRFYSLHKFLDDHYNELLPMMDDLAEQIRMIDGRSIGSVSKLNDAMTVSEDSWSTNDADEMIRDLMFTHRDIREEITGILDRVDGSQEPGIEDFLVELFRKHEKMGWMLKSHLQ